MTDPSVAPPALSLHPHKTSHPMFEEEGELFLNGVKLEPYKAIGFSQSPISQAYWLNDSHLTYICGNSIVNCDLTKGTQQLTPIDSEGEICVFRVFRNAYNQQLYILGAVNKDQCTLLLTNQWKHTTQKCYLDTLQRGEALVDVAYLAETWQVVCLIQGKFTSKITVISEKKPENRHTETLQLKIKSLFQDRRITSYCYFSTPTEIYKCEFRSLFQLEKVQTQLEAKEEILHCSVLNVGGDNNITYVTSGGNLYMVMMGESEIKVEREFLGVGERGGRHNKPTSLCTTDMFILVGYEDLGEITCFRISNLSFQKRTRKDISLNSTSIHQIRSICVSDEQSTICLIAQMKGQAKFHPPNEGTIESSTHQDSSPGRLVPIIFNYLLYETSTVNENNPFETFFDDITTSKAITHVSFCKMRNIIVLLSQDRRITAYKFDYKSKVPLNQMFLWDHQFCQNGLSMDAHPNNFNIAIAFKNDIKVFAMAMGGLRSINLSYPLKCESVRYSTGGHRLAASSNSSILLFNSYSFQLQTVLHFPNTLTHHLQFIHNDQYLLLQSKYSVVLTSTSGKKFLEHSTRNMKVTAAAYDSSFDILVVGYSESVTKFYTDKGSIELGMLCTIPFCFTDFVICHQYKVLLGATSKGTIRVYPWPFFDVEQFQNSFVEIKPHGKAVTCIKVMADMKHLLSCSEDGSLVISRLRHYCNGFQTPDYQLDEMVGNQNKYKLISAFQGLTLDSMVDCSKIQEDIAQIEAKEMAFKEFSDAELLRENTRHRDNFRQFEGEKMVEKDCVTDQYDEVILLQEEEKMRCGEGLLRIGSKFKDMDSLKEALEEELRGIYEVKERLMAQKRSVEQRLTSERLLFLEESKKEQDQIIESNKEELDTRNSSKELQLVEVEEMTTQKSDQAQRQHSEQTLDRNQLYRYITNFIQQENDRKESLERQNHYLSTYIEVYQDRQQKGALLEQTVNTNLGHLSIQKADRENCLRIAHQELQRRDGMILQHEEKAKRQLKFNIYQTNEETCIRYELEQLERQNSELEGQWEALEKEKSNVDKNLVRQTKHRREISSQIEQLSAYMTSMKEQAGQKSQKLYIRRYKFNNAMKQIQGIISSGYDIKSQLFGIMNRLQQDQNLLPTPSNQQTTPNTRQHQRDTYMHMMESCKRLHEDTRIIKNNYEDKMRCQATLLITEYNRLKFEQIDLRDTLHFLEREARIKRERDKEKEKGRERSGAKEMASEIFATAVPEGQARKETQTPMVKRNLKRSRVCKGIVRGKKENVS